MQLVNKVWETAGDRSNRQGGNRIQEGEERPKKNRRNRKSNEYFLD